MRLLSTALIISLNLLSTNGEPLQKRASKSWGGGNSYYLHGLSASDQTYYINSMAADGAKVVRLWGKRSALYLLFIFDDTCLTSYSQSHKA